MLFYLTRPATIGLGKMVRCFRVFELRNIEIMKNFKENTDALMINFLLDSSEFEFKDFDLISANQDLQLLFKATLQQYFLLKKNNPENTIFHESGTCFIFPSKEQ